MKHVILCADDYGQNSAISQAILHLIKKNRLSATSCLATFPNWLNEAEALKSYKNQIDIGLHFNLTEGKSLLSESFYHLPDLIAKCYLQEFSKFYKKNPLDKKKIELELNAQLDHFINGVGCLPDFIDGHQHIHQLPIIRDVIYSIYEKRLRKKNAYIRSTFTPLTSFSLKSIVISMLGAKSFKNHLKKMAIRFNESFSGAYSFNQSKRYAKLFPRFLRKIKHKGIIMCHPALTDSNDPIATARKNEFEYLNSVQFLKDCNTNDVIITRF